MTGQARAGRPQGAKVLKPSPSASASEPTSPTTTDGKKQRLRVNSSGMDSFGSSPRDSYPGTPTSTSMEDANRRRNESLKRALAQAQAARSAAAQRAEELRVGEEWTECFKIPQNRRDPEKLAQFWEEVKSRLLKKYGSLHTAVRTVQSGGDGSVGFLKFCDLLRMINLPLNSSICRYMFDKVADGRREMPVDAFKAMLMEKTIRAMSFVMRGWKGKQARVQAHIRGVLRRLAESNEVNLDRAVDRFQRKLTVSFLRSFWFHVLRRLGGSRSEDSISRSALLKILKDPDEKSAFQDNEVIYMLRIYERIYAHRVALTGSPVMGISVCHLMTGLVLLAPISEEKDKIEVIFEVFDNDYDSCLLYEQIHEMCRCICVLRPMAEESNRGAKDEQFQNELSEQEGQRSYECIIWFLQRSGHVGGGIATLNELWQSLEMQPHLLKSLLPGLTRIRWAAKALPGEDLEEASAQATEEANKEAQVMPSAFAEDPKKDKEKRKTIQGAVPVAVARANMKRGMVGTPPSTGGSAAGRFRDGGENYGYGQQDFASHNLEWQTLDQHFQLGGRAGLRPTKSESHIFKSYLTSKFSKQLRGIGDQRLVELTTGFINPFGDLQDETGRSGTKGESGMGNTTATGQGASPSSPSAASSRASSRPGTGAETPKARGRLSRSGSAPTGLVSKPSTPGASPDQRGGSPVAVKKDEPLPMIGPGFSQEFWGLEAADRFRIYAASKACGDRKDQLWDSKQGKSREPSAAEIQVYKCQLCGRSHKICPGHELLQ
mmetsp:Transcript_98228/g.174890  ORF Transcript_98228/g.174890 Transcript_98228/m.174890 type:complete len:774 (+) Transcript_98228:66-2387(+)